MENQKVQEVDQAITTFIVQEKTDIQADQHTGPEPEVTDIHQVVEVAVATDTPRNFHQGTRLVVGVMTDTDLDLRMIASPNLMTDIQMTEVAKDIQ